MSGTATVEVLTAEVRVLMVGPGPVTLGVAGQLDDVDAEELLPFGRIATGRKPAERERIIEAIGSYEGVLARAVVNAERVRCLGPKYPHNGEHQMPCDKD